jgi:hypothetical protein
MRVRSLCLIVSLAFPLLGHAECTRDNAPAIPDGSTATEADLVTAQQAMKAYMAKNAEYRACLDKEALAATPPKGEKPTKEQVKLDKARTDAYNASVDEEAATAESFNAAVKAWKAAKQ